MCGGLKAPPRTPTAASRIPLLADLAVPVDDVLERCQLAEADRALWHATFWVEFPISAPIPNSKPSVNRVDALT